MVEDALRRRDAREFPLAVLRPPASARGLAILLLLLAVVLGGGVLVVGNMVATLLLVGLSLPFFSWERGSGSARQPEAQGSE